MWSESALLSIGLLAVGVVQIVLGVRRRRRAAESSDERSAQLEQADSSFLLGGLTIAWASHMALKDTDYPWMGLALFAIGLIVWGTTRIRTRNGRAILFLGLFFAAFAVTFGLIL